MKRYLVAIVVLTLILAGISVEVLLNRRSADDRLHLAHPTNAMMDFYGLAVDQDGKPLAGVTFEMVAIAVEGNPFRGEQKDVRTKCRVVTDANGRFEVHATGERIDEVSAVLKGYRLLSDRDGGTGGKEQTAGSNLGFQFFNWGTPTYVGNPANPAIYVLVKDGTTVVTAKVSRGGGVAAVDGGASDSRWWPNKPGFPREPSIKGLTFIEPTTNPATTRTARQP